VPVALVKHDSVMHLKFIAFSSMYECVSILCGSLVNTAQRVHGFRMDEWPPAMERICECIE
jgi:hypothetical protein